MSGAILDGISGATQNLSEIRAIQEEPRHCQKIQKIVNLNSQQIFDALVSLYANYISSNQKKFQDLARSPDIDEAAHLASSSDTSKEKHLASIYISHWFVDLYVSNRKVLLNCLCSYGNNILEQCYSNSKLYHQSYQYDAYLATLNAHIRPTMVKMGKVDTLYIPIMCKDKPDVSEENPFGLEGFVLDSSVFQILIGRLELSQYSNMHVNMADICKKDVQGRPSWLLDWHGQSAYVWFPQEGNYSLDDITVAFTLGVPCSPLLAPTDADEWRYLPPGDELPDNPTHLDRAQPETQHGYFNVRVMETDDWLIPEYLNVQMQPLSLLNGGRKKQKTNTGSATTSDELEDECGSGRTIRSIKRFRLVDYLYYNRVICYPHYYEDGCSHKNGLHLNAFRKIVETFF